MSFDEALDIERKGANAGLTPMFGEWQRRLPFAPVPYGNGRALAAFKDAVHKHLADVQFLYSSELQLEITLYLDMQTVLETSETADLDNYAKAILDTLRGPEGIMFDDTQVQALIISWMDAPETYFTISVKSGADDFVLKGVDFYEMPDGLWYPHGRRMWTNGQIDNTSELSFFAGLLINRMMSGAKRSARIAFRKSGASRLGAYRNSRYFANSARGYHKSRVADAGFALHTLAEWTASLDSWRNAEPSRIDEIETALKEMADRYDAILKALAD